MLFLQCDLREFWIARIPLVSSQIHEIPQYNHTLFWTRVGQHHLTRRAHTHIFLVDRVAFHSCALCMAQDVVRVKRVRVVILCSLPSRSLMSLLNIPHCSFPHVLSSPTCSRSRPSASTTSMGSSFRVNPCEPARWSGMSGRMADPASNTGCEPHPSHFFSPAAAKQQQTEFLSTFGLPSLWKQMADHVSGRPGLQESGGNFGQRICCNNDFFSSKSIGKRDQDTNVVHSLKDRENLQQILERIADSTVRGEMMAMKQRLGLGQEIGKREIPGFDFQEINQEFESQRFQLHQASRWADQAQRDCRLREIN